MFIIELIYTQNLDSRALVALATCPTFAHVCVVCPPTERTCRMLFDGGRRWLVDFDGGVDLANESTGSQVGKSAAHQTQGDAEQGHVSEIESRLKQAVHLRLLQSFERQLDQIMFWRQRKRTDLKEEVVKGVEIDIAGRRGTSHERRPLPADHRQQ